MYCDTLMRLYKLSGKEPKMGKSTVRERLSKIFGISAQVEDKSPSKEALKESLGAPLSEVKALIQGCLASKRGSTEEYALAQELEEKLRIVGASVEARALQLGGWNTLEAFNAFIEEEIRKHAVQYKNEKITKAKEYIKETEDFIEKMDALYPIAYPARFWSKKDAKIYRISKSLNKSSRKQIKMHQRYQTFEDLEMEDLPLKLRDAYLLALSEIRPFGGELLFENYFDYTKGKGYPYKESRKEYKNNLKNKDKDLEIAELLANAARLFPSDWLVTSNENSRRLFFKDSRGLKKKEKLDPGLPMATYGERTIYKGNIRLKKLDETLRKKIEDKGKWRVAVLELNEIDSYEEGSIVHELGHRFNDSLPIIGLIEEAYFLRRTTNPDGSRTNLAKGKKNNRRLGDFVNPQTGQDPVLKLTAAAKSLSKEFPGYFKKDKTLTKWLSPKKVRKQYEVFSTGLPAVLSGEYGGLAGVRGAGYETWHDGKSDTELRHLILGILAAV